MSTAKNTRQVLQNKPKQYWPFLNPKSTAHTIKENIELQIKISFESNNIFSQIFQNNGCGIASFDNYLIHDKWRNLDASLNLIKKDLGSFCVIF